MNLLNKTPQAAARRLAHKALAEGFKPEALHEYTDVEGNPLHWRIRLKHPESGEKWIRPMRPGDAGDYALGEPEYLTGKPLYNLHRLSMSTCPVIVCEGEWCVDKLTALGIVSTTSGAADSVSKADWSPLTGKHVIIFPDFDEHGQRYAVTVAVQLKKLGCSILCIDTKELGLPPKGDVVDWLANNPNATCEDIFSLPKIPDWIDELEGDVENTDFLKNSDTEEKTANRPNQASLLVDFVAAHVLLFHDENLEVYAQNLSTLETRRLDGRQFKDWLVAQFYTATGKSPRDQSLREAIATLSGLARHKGKCHPVYLRVAAYDDAYFLDLAARGESQVVCITPGKWEIVTKAPVRFLRPETFRQLPKPTSGGDLSQLWKMANIPENDRILVITWLLECLRPDTPFPLLELIGEQGSAKSTIQALLRQLIDPNACDLRGAPKTVEDVFVSAGVNWLLSYENISHLSPAIQDALCIVATGGGYAKRKLYSDADESVITVKRPIMLNGISAAVTAQDLIDRAISIETPRINTKTDISELWNNYQSAHSNLLGALLDIFAQTLVRLPHMKLPSTEQPRLSEFARLGMAVAETLGQSKESFLDQFNKSRQESIARTLDASPVATALLEWFFEIRQKVTTVLPIKNLFEAVARQKPENTDAWPRSPKGFADALRRAAPALRQMGVECRSLGKTGSYVSWEIRALSEK